MTHVIERFNSRSRTSGESHEQNRQSSEVIPSEQSLVVTVMIDVGSAGEAMVSMTLLNEANQVFLPLIAR
ncbi:MAG: hypothetical protein AAF639_36700 [Chloroflexota bacterium]